MYRYCTIVALALAVLCGVLFAPLAPGHPYYYDEADYMWAGSQGFWANFTDRGAIPFAEYVRRGLELSKDSSKRTEFSRFIRESGDLGMYRHYHGPIYAYWLSAMHAVGVTSENGFRSSGLILHALTGFTILFGFWRAFPQWHPLAGLAACALFLFNRTALTGAMGITQHVVFTLTTAMTLFALTFFVQTWDRRWWWAAIASLAVSFATVETSALLVMAIVVVLLLEYKRLQWSLLWQGIGVFVATLLVVWPKAVLELSIAKGFMMLVYIAVYRKTFSPIGPVQLLVEKITASPWELLFLMAGAVTAFALWRSMAHRKELTPWICFSAVFLLVVLKVTAPYSYYYAPLTLAFTVLTGAVIGEMSRLHGRPVTGVLMLAAAVSIAGASWQHVEIWRDFSSKSAGSSALLEFLRREPVAVGKKVYLPYEYLPTVHYYLPAIRTAGYDRSLPPAELSQQLAQPDVASFFLCEEATCQALPHIARKALLAPRDFFGGPLYAGWMKP